MGIGHAIEITCHDSVNIVKRETPKVTEKCLVIGMFIRHVNIKGNLGCWRELTLSYSK